MDLAGVHVLGFIIRDFETMLHGPFWCFVEFFYSSHIFGPETNEEVIDYNDQLILWGVGSLILIMNRIRDRMLLWGTPISCGLGSKSILFIHIWKVWPSRKCFMKMKVKIFAYAIWPWWVKVKKKLQPNGPFWWMFFWLRFLCGLFSLCFLRIGMVVARFYKVGILSEIKILLYIPRRYFRDIVGSSLRRVLWISSGPVAELLDLVIEFWSLVRVKSWL